VAPSTFNAATSHEQSIEKYGCSISDRSGGTGVSPVYLRNQELKQ